MSFDELYAAHGDRIYRLCYRLSRNHADAEDLAQEVLLLAYQSIDRFEGRASISTWLYRIALHRWLRVRDQRGPQPESLDSALTTEPAGRDLTDVHVDRISLEAAIEQLSEPLWQAVMLVKCEGLTYREAAKILDVPQGTVQRRVHDATVQLRRLAGVEDTSRSSRAESSAPEEGDRSSR